jgi:hypothetical protein
MKEKPPTKQKSSLHCGFHLLQRHTKWTQIAGDPLGFYLCVRAVSEMVLLTKKGASAVFRER